MTDRVIGWMFVSLQAILLVALVLLGGDDHWPTPRWLDVISTGVVGLGLVVVAVGALGLGSALTPTPVPLENAALETGGLYSRVRHPIYTGVLIIVIGLTVGSGSWVSAVLGSATVVFFNAKAAWEERRLVSRYADYESYASRTPRFVPRIGRSTS